MNHADKSRPSSVIWPDDGLLPVLDCTPTYGFLATAFDVSITLQSYTFPGSALFYRHRLQRNGPNRQGPG